MKKVRLDYSYISKIVPVKCVVVSGAQVKLTLLPLDGLLFRILLLLPRPGLLPNFSRSDQIIMNLCLRSRENFNNFLKFDVKFCINDENFNKILKYPDPLQSIQGNQK
jgi:hypothetical protein